MFILVMRRTNESEKMKLFEGTREYRTGPPPSDIDQLVVSLYLAILVNW